MTDIHKLIAAISPDVYCDSEKKKEVKEIVKKGPKEGKSDVSAYIEAAKKAEPNKSEILFKWDDAKNNPLKKWGLKSPSEKHEIQYNSPSESLEPIYFWIFGFLNDIGMKSEKLIDNFVSSPGSGHFGEMGQRVTLMQKEGMNMLGSANQVLKSILNLIYDLKEMKLVLINYEDFELENRGKKIPAMYSLKQRWMDMVDIRKGQGSINALASGQLDFVSLRDAFMIAESVKDVEKMDLNDRVKRILTQRLNEFFTWVTESGRQLKQRYNIEKKYLKSQVNTLHLYSRWIKPYLKAAAALEQRANPHAGLVNTFNTVILELTLMAKSEYKPKEDENLPKFVKNAEARTYHSIVIIEFNFTGIPQRVTQRGDWSFGGTTIIKFTSYALHDDELKVLKEAIKEDDLGELIDYMEGVTTESLGEIKDDIDSFIKEDEVKKEKEENEKKERKENDANPFSALFSSFGDMFKKKKKEEKKDDDLSKFKTGIKSDSEEEKVIRSQAIIEAREKSFLIYDVYKKSHQMPGHLSPYDSMAG